MNAIGDEVTGQHDSQIKAQSFVEEDRPESPGPSFVSMKGDGSMVEKMDFKYRRHSTKHSIQSIQEEKAVYSASMGHPENFKDRPHSTEHAMYQERVQSSHVASIFTLLEKNMATFMKNELRALCDLLSPDYPECLMRENREAMDVEEVKQRRIPAEAVLQMSLYFLRRMKLEELADSLESKSLAVQSQTMLKCNMREKFGSLYEGVAKPGQPALLNQIYTELYITEGGSGEVNNEHEVRQIETASRKPAREETSIKCEDLFKPLPGHVKPTRTILTKGVAGIGKTVLTQKFTLDWAENNVNHNIQFMFPVTFRELNLLKGKKYSLVELLHRLFYETKEAEIFSFDNFRVLFILDGLDEYRLPLDFQNNEVWTDVNESTSVDVLLTNLIKGNLLPSAHLWITTRPAAANQIPPEYVDVVTEVRGFTDPQKEEYFKKRFRDEKQASRIISHIKSSRSLHIMCHIPVFCWITATVLDHVLTTDKSGEMPNTLTDMYSHFLVVQSKQGNVKYQGRSGADPLWNTESREIIESLGKLAFEQLKKGNVIFYETDLAECDIDLRAASVYSGVLTQIFKEECGLYQDKVFCFVHLSIQEFLAAVHVFLSFINTGVNLLLKTQGWWSVFFQYKSKDLHLANLHHSAVDKALQSQNGHLDMFLRFLLGLSLETNQNLLSGLVKQPRSFSQDNQDTVKYIKMKISENTSAERSINLFHCLNELKDHSLVEEVQQNLRSGCLSTDRLSAGQWSALVFILLSSENDLDVLDLKRYSTSEEGLLRLLPVVKASSKALLDGCNLSKRSCEALASVLSSKSSSLRELDLSDNDLEDSGVKLLSCGLGSPHCRLETLRLSGCLVTEAGCSSLASALSDNPSHLRELDLSYNHPGDSGVTLLSAGLEDPHWRLDTLCVDHAGEWRLEPRPTRYACQPRLDQNTAQRCLFLSEERSKATYVGIYQSYADHPGRFTSWPQVLCREALIGRCYWEVVWRGGVGIGVTYRGINRGVGDRCCLGWYENSWALECSDEGYSARHNNVLTGLDLPPAADPPVSNRVGVFLDWPAGRLTFYSVSSGALSHIHTFHCRFTEEVLPGFRLVWAGSSVCLADGLGTNWGRSLFHWEMHTVK